MKKAPALSTICISLAAAMVATAPALADMPRPGSCFVRLYDQAHLARNPQQGVEALTVWFDRERTIAPLAMYVEAQMGWQGQARADGVAGMVLVQAALCDINVPGACAVDCDGGNAVPRVQADGRLRLSTRYFRIEDPSGGCGGYEEPGSAPYSSLDEGQGGETVYLLHPAPVSACAGLMR